MHKCAELCKTVPNYAQVGRFRKFLTDLSQIGTVLNSVAHFCTVWHKSFSAVENKYNFISDTVVHSFTHFCTLQNILAQFDTNHFQSLKIKLGLLFGTVVHSSTHYGTF